MNLLKTLEIRFSLKYIIINIMTLIVIFYYELLYFLIGYIIFHNLSRFNINIKSLYLIAIAYIFLNFLKNS